MTTDMIPLKYDRAKGYEHGNWETHPANEL